MASAPLRYPTKAEITRAVQAARAADIIVGGIEIGRNGTIRILPPQVHTTTTGSAFERWKASKQDN